MTAPGTITRHRSWFSRLAHNERGIAATEFALVLPIMVLMLMGMVEVRGAVEAYGKALSATQTVADLTSRADSQTTTTMNVIASAAQRVLDPMPSGSDRLGIRVASIGIATNGTPTLLWSYSFGGATDAPNLEAARGLASPGESVIMVNLTYIHPPLLKDIVGTLTTRETAWSRPRLVRLIPYNGSTGVLP
ncbi:MAG: pilus assembly protein [Magnetospirillum sp.]|nr:pilus assembly protein [Magnetospirillum sp.]